MTEIRFLRRHARLAALLGVTAAIVFSGVAVAAVAPVEGTSSLTAWTNSTPTIDAGESVTFKNTSATTPHGVGFDAPPVAPGCTGVPGGTGGTSWEGSCTFSQAGSYPFHCTVHPAMTGTVTVQSAGPEKPAVTTGTATAITDVGATLGGSVNPNGLETEYFFKYGTDTNYGQTTGTTTLSAGTSSVAASKAAAGLSPGTTYHFRLVATNTSGTTEGGDKTFITTGPPLVTTNPATGVSGVGATLQGTVNPRGHETSYFFEWGTDTSYGKTTSVLKKTGIATAPVSAILTGLSPETEYHFRLVADNSSSTEPVKGADKTFKTTATASPPPPEEKPPVVTPPLETPVTPIVTPPAEAAPDTKMTSKPKAKSTDSTPTFKFSATVSGATFECQLDGKAFKSCRSPLTTKALKPGRHSFKVRAVGPTGLKDPSPAAISFKVVKPAKRK